MCHARGTKARTIPKIHELNASGFSEALRDGLIEFRHQPMELACAGGADWRICAFVRGLVALLIVVAGASDAGAQLPTGIELGMAADAMRRNTGLAMAGYESANVAVDRLLDKFLAGEDMQVGVRGLLPGTHQRLTVAPLAGYKNEGYLPDLPMKGGALFSITATFR